MWRRLADTLWTVAVIAVALAPAAGPLTAAGLAGTILVSRPTGLNLVQPLSGDTQVVPLGGAGAAAQGVAWSDERQQAVVSVRMRQAGERAGGADLLVLDASGLEVSSVVRDQPDVALLSPAWLPTGEIAYERADNSPARKPSRVEASQPDGSSRRLLLANAHLPGPSADGSRLAFLAPGQPFDRLMMMDLSSGDTRVLIDNASEGFVYFSRPRFSPDGQTIAFGAAGGPTLSRSDPLTGLGFATRGGAGLFGAPRLHGPGWDVWSVGVDGTGLRQVTAFNYEDDLAVAWSPDGQWLAAFGPNALYLVPMSVSGPATPIGRGGLGEPDWAATELLPASGLP